MMVQPADFGQLHDRTQRWWLYEPRVRRVHIERSMDAPRMIVVHVGSKHTVEMPLVEHDDMIETLAPDTPNEPLAVRILPRRSGRNLHFFDTHVADSLLKELAVD